jgi:hypothetical protein
VNGTNEKMISNAFKMRDSIFYRVPLSREKRSQKKSMLIARRKSGLKKPKTRNAHWLKFREKESRFFVRCTRHEKMLNLRLIKEISLKTMLTLAPLSMHP